MRDGERNRGREEAYSRSIIMADIKTFTDAKEAWATAKRMARYGHRTWLLWPNPDGTRSIARRDAESIKAAMEAVGPEGIFSSLEPSTAIPWRIRRWQAEVWLQNAEAGYLSD